MSPAIRWHMVTGEYPPQAGGVGDYSRLVARGLAAAGDTVQVYAPESSEADTNYVGVTVHRLRGHFGAHALSQLSRLLGRRNNDRLLVQFVPHAFGFKAMNLAFCLWLYAYSLINGGVTVIFHEVNLGFRIGDPVRYRLLDAMTKVMARLVARSASRIFVATLAWESRLRGYVSPNQPIVCLPVPSSILIVSDRVLIAETRRRFVPSQGPLVGHLGTYSSEISAMLRAIVPRILADDPSLTMILMGTNSDTFRESLINEIPALAARVVATGTLPGPELSMAIASCDVMAQPYPDGVTSRRTSVMAALDHGRAIVTTQGLFTEPLWPQSAAVALAPVDDPGAFASAVSELIGSEDRRRRYEIAAKALYADRFDVCHTIKSLRAEWI
jgi:glycosyltransferase involved in cell wall biosynthesis